MLKKSFFKNFSIILLGLFMLNIIPLDVLAKELETNNYESIMNKEEIKNNIIDESKENNQMIDESVKDEENIKNKETKDDQDIKQEDEDKKIQEKDLNEELFQKEENINKENKDIINDFKYPADGSKTTENVYIKGVASSELAIAKVEVYVNGNFVGNANHDIIINQVPNSYDYELKNLKDGINELKVIVIDSENNKSEKKKIINVNSKQKTEIMGKSNLDRNKMVQALIDRNPNKDLEYSYYFVDEIIEEANAEGVRYDLIFAQIMHETNYLKFGGDVKEEQNNFAGLGATGNGNPGESFPTIEIGIRAVVQHLKAYASKEPLNRECVDTRFKYVERGTAIYLEHLGINENPKGKGWAANKGYGYLIYDIMEKNEKINTDKLNAYIISIDVLNEAEVEKSVKIKANASSNSLYRITVRDENNNWKVIKDYNSNSITEWTPENSGVHRIVVDVKSKYSTNDYDDFKYKDVNVKSTTSKLNFLKINGELFENLNIEFEAEGDKNNNLYKFSLKDYSTNQWIVLNDFNEKNKIEWKANKAGKYRIVIDIKHKSSENEYDDYKYLDFTINESKSYIDKFNYSGNLYINKKIEFNSVATNEALYKYSIKNYEDDSWIVIKDYSKESKAEFIPKKAGKYRVVLDVKHKYSKNEYDDYKFIDFVIKENIADINLFEIEGIKKTGETVTFKTEGISGNNILYKYSIKNYEDNSWQTIKEYDKNNIVSWIPKKAGKYRVVVEAKDEYSKNEYDDYYYEDVIIEPKELAIIKSMDIIEGSTINEKIIKVDGKSENQVLYKYSLKNYLTNEWIVLSEYSDKNSIKFNVPTGGKYRIVVDIKDKYSINSYDNFEYKDIEIYSDDKAIITNLRVKGSSDIKDKKVIEAEAKSTNGVLYKYEVKDNTTGEVKILQNFSENKSFEWVVNNPAQYTVIAYVKDKFSSKEYDNSYSVVTEIYGNGIITNKNLNYIGELKTEKNIKISAKADSRNGVLYRFTLRHPNGSWELIKDYSENGIMNYTFPKEVGSYRFVIDFKDKYSNREYDSYDYYTLNIKKDNLIVIDPGHSIKSLYGIDSGAVSKHNGVTYKEDILNMQVALKLKNELEKLNYKVLLTQDSNYIATDKTVKESLERRVNFANSNDAELMISLHHNIGPTSAKGTEVYYSSSRTENIDFDDFATNKKLANNLSTAISKAGGYNNRGSKDNNFFVTKNAKMYSVLAEVAFISNPTEAIKAADQSTQQKVAKAMAESIDQFLKNR